jgi:hypothetical protein
MPERRQTQKATHKKQASIACPLHHARLAATASRVDVQMEAQAQVSHYTLRLRFVPWRIAPRAGLRPSRPSNHKESSALWRWPTLVAMPWPCCVLGCVTSNQHTRKWKMG